MPNTRELGKLLADAAACDELFDVLMVAQQIAQDRSTYGREDDPDHQWKVFADMFGDWSVDYMKVKP